MHMEKVSRQLRCTMILLLLACHVTGIHGNSDIQEKTYPHTINGVLFTCNKCLPGTHLLQHCMVDGGDANCTACVDGKTYNTDFNIARSCAQCSIDCRAPNREDLVKKCTPTANISCQCKKEYYRQSVSFDPLCLEIDACPPGKGVLTQGGGFSNTACENCQSHVSFSNRSSKMEPCQPCVPCSEGFIMKLGSCGPVNDPQCVAAYKKDGLSNVEIVAIVMGCIVVVLIVLSVVLVCTRTDRGRMIRDQFIHCQRNYDPCEKHIPSSEHEKQKPMLNGNMTYDNDVKVALSDDTTYHEHNVGNDRHHGSAGNTLPTMPSQCPEQASGISDRDFSQLRDDLVNPEYPQFFRLLFADGADIYIHEMQMDYQQYGVKEIIYQLLVKWREVEQENASPDKVISALKDWGRQGLVEKYTKYFGQSGVHTSPISDTRNSSTSTVSYSRSNAGSISTDV